MKKIYKNKVSDEIWKKEMSMISHTSQWRANKRGWMCPGYHIQDIKINLCLFNYELAKKVAAILIRRFFIIEKWHIPNYISFDDIAQEIVLRIYLRSGHIKPENDVAIFLQYYAIGKYAVFNCINKK